jgi:hypothetical protein
MISKKQIVGFLMDYSSSIQMMEMKVDIDLHNTEFCQKALHESKS